MRSLAPKDQVGEIAACTWFVREKIRYVMDVYDVETIQTPEATLELGQGDCDDKAALLASLVISIGFPAQFCVLKRDGDFVHVWTMAGLDGMWIDLETTEPVKAGNTAKFMPGDETYYFPVTP